MGNVHTWIVTKKEKYVTVLEGGVEFTIPSYPGYYPSAALDYPKVWLKKESQHKAEILEHDVSARVVQVIKGFIIEALDE